MKYWSVVLFALAIAIILAGLYGCSPTMSALYWRTMPARFRLYRRCLDKREEERDARTREASEAVLRPRNRLDCSCELPDESDRSSRGHLQRSGTEGLGVVDTGQLSGTVRDASGEHTRLDVPLLPYGVREVHRRHRLSREHGSVGLERRPDPATPADPLSAVPDQDGAGYMVASQAVPGVLPVRVPSWRWLLG